MRLAGTKKINIGKNKNGYRDRTHGFAKKYDIHVLKIMSKNVKLLHLSCCKHSLNAF